MRLIKITQVPINVLAKSLVDVDVIVVTLHSLTSNFIVDSLFSLTIKFMTSHELIISKIS